jgi:hypothetical protein
VLDPLRSFSFAKTGRTGIRYAPRRKIATSIIADEANRFQSLYAMASISILAPTMFFACNVEREGLLPGKNSA